MSHEVKLSNLESAVSTIEFPASRGTLVEETEAITLLLADGTANLGELVASSDVERFESPDDLRSALMNVLPRRAVGEPYQSEGDS